MKTMFSIIFLLSMMFMIAGCATDQSDQQNAASDTLNINNDYVVQILDCVLSKDANGKDVAVASYQFTNNTADAVYFNGVFYDQLFQDGVEQHEDESFLGEGYDWSTYYKEIKDGASITVYSQFPLSNTTSPVEVEVHGFEEDQIAKKSFTLS